MRRTVGALPRRPEPEIPAVANRLRPPAPNARPRLFTHQGDPNQAYALIGWSTLGGIGHIRERRALAVAANMFETRLFDRLREQEGASYGPDATHLAADSFPDWGVLYAASEISRPAPPPSSASRARSSPISPPAPLCPTSSRALSIRC